MHRRHRGLRRRLGRDYERQHGPDSRWLVETLILIGRARHAVAHAQALALAARKAQLREQGPWSAVLDGFTASRRNLERALTLRRKHDLPAVQADALLALARTLWDGDLPPPHGPARAAAPDDPRSRGRALAAAATQRRPGAGEALRQTEQSAPTHSRIHQRVEGSAAPVSADMFGRIRPLRRFCCRRRMSR